MSAKETPAELFKRSLAQTTRALAGREEELEVTFGAEGPQLMPGRIVLPHPPRVICDREAERLRGQADALALRLAYHDDAQHKQATPLKRADARAVFDAVEEMRVQALGANAMKRRRQQSDRCTHRHAGTQRRGAHARSRAARRWRMRWR